MLDMVNPFPSRGSPLMSKIVWHKITKGTVFCIVHGCWCTWYVEVWYSVEYRVV